MGYRAAFKADVAPGPPTSPLERSLETIQSRLVLASDKVAALTSQRDAMVMQLWESGHTQAEIAHRLDRSSRRAGGEGVTVGAVQKRLWRRQS